MPSPPGIHRSDAQPAAHAAFELCEPSLGLRRRPLRGRDVCRTPQNAKTGTAQEGATIEVGMRGHGEVTLSGCAKRRKPDVHWPFDGRVEGPSRLESEELHLIVRLLAAGRQPGAPVTDVNFQLVPIGIDKVVRG